ncbi:hypothetical protein GCM10007857_66900 [Bradyrhizobium iriomotense]|uniref:Uncharacterized protein n=1 Tax=Bradyrhizobium iriomotense TaxID=441950 RepID=A0ABQ6BBF2_9BRAD|nr:hypothetical protein GCM10007857_66900 [Bradyrhizobium iriomotense]
MSQTQMFAPRPSITPPDRFREIARRHLCAPAGEHRRHPSTRRMTRPPTDALERGRGRTADTILSEATSDYLERSVAEVLKASNDYSLELNSTLVAHSFLLDHGRVHIRRARNPAALHKL